MLSTGDSTAKELGVSLHEIEPLICFKLRRLCIGAFAWRSQGKYCIVGSWLNLQPGDELFEFGGGGEWKRWVAMTVALLLVLWVQVVVWALRGWVLHLEFRRGVRFGIAQSWILSFLEVTMMDLYQNHLEGTEKLAAEVRRIGDKGSKGKFWMQSIPVVNSGKYLEEAKEQTGPQHDLKWPSIIQFACFQFLQAALFYLKMWLSNWATKTNHSRSVPDWDQCVSASRCRGTYQGSTRTSYPMQSYSLTCKHSTVLVMAPHS